MKKAFNWVSEKIDKINNDFDTERLRLFGTIATRPDKLRPGCERRLVLQWGRYAIQDVKSVEAGSGGMWKEKSTIMSGMTKEDGLKYL